MSALTQPRSRPAIPVVAIVGGGFSGCLTAVHLLREARSPLKLLLIERHDQPGRGVAYRDQPECHVLNVRAEGMSAFPAEPDHFLSWLNASYSPCHPVGSAEFLPRRIYGAYLQDVLREAMRTARPGVTLAVVNDEVTGLARRGDATTLRLKSGKTLRAAQVVLALGNPAPVDPPVAETSFYASPRYSPHAWSGDALNAVRRDDSVLLIGSGLTTLDWLAALAARGHRGMIHVVSRRGLLPQLHRAAAPVTLSFDPLALPAKASALLARLREEIARVEAADGDWRAVIDALRPYTQRLWSRLPQIERRRFLRHVRPYWEIHRHRAAPKVVEAVYERMRAGKLELRAARLLGFEETADGVAVLLQPRGTEAIESRFVQRVVNCTGPESNYRRLNHPLVAGLREQGLIHADPLGLGLETDDHGALIGPGGEASGWLHTLGPARKGQLWETTAVPEIRIQAQALALRLLRHLGRPSMLPRETELYHQPSL